MHHRRSPYIQITIKGLFILGTILLGRHWVATYRGELVKNNANKRIYRMAAAYKEEADTEGNADTWLQVKMFKNR